MLNRRKLLQLVPNLTLAGLLSSRISAKSITPVVTSEKIKEIENIYNALGVRTLINARGTVTIVGATKMLPEVKRAMDLASSHYVQIDELMEGVGKKLSDLTGAEWGCVTSGASAAITFGTLACITGGDPDKLWKIPDLTGMKSEVIIPYYSRTAYECAARSTGAKMISVSTQEELKHAIGPNTAMVLVLTGKYSAEGPLSIEKIAALTAPRGIPILADAAAEELVVPNPHLAQGADMVAYSGGKCLRGPQCAGLLLGRKDLVQAAWLTSAPHHGFGRGHKVGREEIIGMLTAVEMWFKRDHQKENALWTEWLEQISQKISTVSGVTTAISQPGERLSNRFPNLEVTWDQNQIPLTGYDLENLLWEAEPRIAVSGAGSFLPFPPNMNPSIRINPSQMDDGEAPVVAQKLYDILSNPPEMSNADKSPLYDLSGQWEVVMEFQASEVSQSFVFEQEGSELRGSHIGGFATRNLTGSIHGSEVLIRSSYTDNGVRLNFEFTGSVKGDTMGGAVSLSEYGMAKWKAKRKRY